MVYFQVGFYGTLSIKSLFAYYICVELSVKENKSPSVTIQMKNFAFQCYGSQTALGYAVKLDVNPGDRQNGSKGYSLPLSDR